MHWRRVGRQERRLAACRENAMIIHFPVGVGICKMATSEARSSCEKFDNLLDKSLDQIGKLIISVREGK